MSTQKTPDHAEVAEELAEMLAQSGFVSRIVARETGIGARLTIHLVLPEFANRPQDSVGSTSLRNDFLSDVEDELKRGPYRKRHELPDPEKPASAEVNRRTRTTAVFNARIDPEIIALVEEFREKSGRQKRDIVEEALVAYVTAKEQKEPS